MPDAATFRALRGQLGLSQVATARLLGVPARTVEDWEARAKETVALRLACEVLRLRLEGCAPRISPEPPRRDGRSRAG